MPVKKAPAKSKPKLKATMATKKKAAPKKPVKKK
jgi:hypothetical protein